MEAFRRRRYERVIRTTPSGAVPSAVTAVGVAREVLQKK
jgi:hypothetical protein